MDKVAVGVMGASGYAGGELVRLIDGHPGLELAVLAGHSSAGGSLGDVHPHLPGPERVLVSLDDAVAVDVDLMFMALPHGASAVPAMALIEQGRKVVDLGADFRLVDPAVYEAAYGAPHAYPEQLGAWPYGLPELERDQIKMTDRVAVPGCYPTSVILAMAPLVAAGLVADADIVVNSLSGVSGAGRGLKPNLSYGAIDESVAAYAVGAHRHRPEMEQAIAASSGTAVRVSFTPHLVPMQRGLLSTCSAHVVPGTGIDELAAVLHKAYDDEPFVAVVTEPPQTRWVVGSNRCVMSVHRDEHTDRVIVTSAIDNLLKGAAGQAVQCANLMVGYDEAAGLPVAGWMP